MASLVLTGDTSGQVTISAPAVAGTNTLTLQAATATSSVNTLATAVATTSGTSIDFTSLPSWVKRVTVMFAGVSVSASSIIQVQLGTGSTSYTTTGYLGGGWFANTTNTVVTTGIPVIASGAGAGARAVSGTMTIANLTGNTWVASATIFDINGSGCLSGSHIVLGAALTAVRLTTVNGTDTFDAGTINLLLEG